MIDLIFNAWNGIVLVVGVLATVLCYLQYKQTKSRPLLTCLPGIWTSLGLLGTFCAICWSLHDLNVSPEVIDNTGKTLGEVQKAAGNDLDIMNIIKEIIPAFTTSIIGLIFAMGITIWTKFIFSKEEKAADEELDNRSPEDYIREIAENTQTLNEQYDKVKMLVELIESQQKTNAEYSERLNNNIGKQSEILKEFIEGFVNRMEEVYKTINSTVQEQVKMFGQEQFDKTSQILHTIAENMASVSTNIISQQKDSVEAMMNTTNAQIGVIAQSVTEVLEKLSTDIQESLTKLEGQQSEKLTNIISNYDSLADRLSQQNTEFASKVSTKLQEEYERVQQHNVASLQQMVDLRNAYQEATEEVISKTLDMNETVTANLRESMSGFVSDIQNSIATQCSTLGTAITQNVESLNKAYQFIQSLVAEIRQNYDQAVLAFGDAVDVAHRTNEAAEKAVKETNNSLIHVEETNNRISEVIDILTERQENIEQLTKQISSMSAVIVQLQKLELTLNRFINK